MTGLTLETSATGRKALACGALFALALIRCAECAESDLIAEALRAEPGSVVADVGAGEGEWAAELARRVGESGRVYATEVRASLVGEIRRAAEAAGNGNVTVVLGDQDSSGLPAACCDAILLRLVYHHFTRPAAMREDLRRALRPEGRLLIVDIEPQASWRELPEVPDRGGHGIPVEDLLRELTGDGFELVERIDRWNGDPDRYGLLFSLRDEAP